MKKEKFEDILGEIDENLIEDTANTRIFPKKKPILKYASILASALSIGLLIYFVFGIEKNNLVENQFGKFGYSSKVLANADYPNISEPPSEFDEKYKMKNDIFDYDKFQADLESFRDSIKVLNPSTSNYDDGYLKFVKRINEIIIDIKDEENFVYSPLNIYFAASMLPEITDGKTKKEILDLLGEDSELDLRKSVSDLWKTNFVNTESFKSLLANSVWLNDAKKFEQGPLDILKNHHFASSFSGDFTKESFVKDIKTWKNANTFNLLKDSVEKTDYTKDVRLVILSTIYYKNNWQKQYKKENNIIDKFHTSSGDIDIEYMRASSYGSIYESPIFKAYEKNLSYSEYGVDSLTFIRPEDNVDIQKILKSEDFKSILTGSDFSKNAEYKTVEEYIPKFDITANFDVKKKFEELGINSIFTPHSADFSKLTKEMDLFVSDISHDARFVVDEDGIEAAAITEISVTESAMEDPEIVEFKLDRPFIFILKNSENLPIFVGIVNNPKL